MNQEERLNYLIEEFKKESIRYKNIRVGNSMQEKQTILRSLMNIRMPGEMDEEILNVEDQYLQERVKEKGIVCLDEISTIKQLGSCHKHGGVISIWQGDITRLKVDAIVNAANSQMLGCFIPMHTCIDNCIHTFAGIQLRNECNRQMNLKRKRFGEDYQQPVAEPMLTDGYNLPCEKIIHVVGPAVEGRLTDEHEKQLANCYLNVLDMCRDNGLRSVAFCCISTGVFNFPNEKAAEIAVDTVTRWLDDNPETMDRVVFNVFKDMDRYLYERELL